MNPTIGRIVHYADGSKIVVSPAIITKVRTPTVVDLAIFPSCEVPGPVRCVGWVPLGEGEGVEKGHWRWPPREDAAVDAVELERLRREWTGLREADANAMAAWSSAATGRLLAIRSAVSFLDTCIQQGEGHSDHSRSVVTSALEDLDELLARARAEAGGEAGR